MFVAVSDGEAGAELVLSGWYEPGFESSVATSSEVFRVGEYRRVTVPENTFWLLLICRRPTKKVGRPRIC